MTDNFCHASSNYEQYVYVLIEVTNLQPIVSFGKI